MNGKEFFKLDKEKKRAILQNKVKILGVIWAVSSTLGYAILFLRVGRYRRSLLYKMLFSFVYIFDWIERMINPNFSVPFFIVYTSRTNIILFIFIVVIAGMIGGLIGVGVEYTGRYILYIYENRKKEE
ncbi:MAG: hypothetical protein ACE5PM_03180 [Candidatus Hydrothermarchaeales archaeon]